MTLTEVLCDNCAGHLIRSPKNEPITWIHVKVTSALDGQRLHCRKCFHTKEELTINYSFDSYKCLIGFFSKKAITSPQVKESGAI